MKDKSIFKFFLLSFLFISAGTYWGRYIAATPVGYMPEIFYLIFLAYAFFWDPDKLNRLATSIVSSPATLLFIFVILFSFVASIFRSIGIKESYSHLRVLVGFVFAYHLGASDASVNRSKLLNYISALLFAYILYYFVFGSTTVSEEMVSKFRFPVIISLVGVHVAAKFGMNLRGIFLLMLCFLLAAVSNYRIYLMMSVIFLMYFIFMISIRGRNYFLGYIFGLMMVSLAALASGMVIYWVIYGGGNAIASIYLDDGSYSQLITKSEALFDKMLGGGGDNSVVDNSVADRVLFLGVVFDNLVRVVFPFGLGPDVVMFYFASIDYLNTIDSGIGFSLVHFGFIPSVVLVILVFYGIKIPAWKDYFVLLATIAFYYFIAPEIFAIGEIAISTAYILGAFGVVVRNGG